MTADSNIQICQHVQLLGHSHYGVTELRTFEPRPMVAYADNENNIVRLAMELYRKVPGVHVGIQPRPLDLFDNAPNCRENGLALSSTICCSGNGHYVLAPIIPIQVDGDNIAEKFRRFCNQMAKKISRQVSGIKIDPVYNLSRVMRLMGTVNGKGQPSEERPHRRAHFVTEPIYVRSMALYHMILNTEIPTAVRGATNSSDNIRCDLNKIESCEFIKWCRKKPMDVSEPQWFAMITNLANLKGGPKLMHEISSLDMFRYDHQQTQRLIERVQGRGYSPANCKTIRNNGFYCAKFRQCHVKAPMYLTHLSSGARVDLEKWKNY